MDSLGARSMWNLGFQLKNQISAKASRGSMKNKMQGQRCKMKGT